MELINFLTSLGCFTKVYDSQEKYDNNENVNLLFVHRLPKNNINDRLPLPVLFRMYNNVNFNCVKNITSYTQTLKFLNKLDDNQIHYVIYIDKFGDYRRIMVNCAEETVHVRNMYF